ncbi:hypothetical protein BSLG_001865 [Batrachochytrium salamandrivorans]|nr:hypothetical protein BSLG_001865 [Batrachochytrium salamandrivorans]
MNKRQAHPDKEAIYFISSTQDSVKAIIEDYTKARPLYSAAHVFCTSALSDQLFDRIQRSPAINHLKTCKELNIDFFAPDSQSFLFDYPDSWYTLFNPHVPSLLRYELDIISKRIVSVLATLGEYPYIRYHTRPTMFSTSPQKSLSQDLALMVQEELDKLCTHDASFPPQSPYKRPVMIITDRSIDVLAPLLHEFSYQAMAGDLIGLETGKYKDRRDGKETIIDETDPIWSEVRTWHIAEVLDYLPELFKRFTSENKAAKWELEGNSGVESGDKIQGLKDAMGSLGVYQEMKAKYAVHTSMCEDVMSLYKDRMLEKVSEVEQNLAMTDPNDASKTRLLLSDVVRIIEDSSIAHLDKVRLIMLAIISQGGVQDSDRQRFLERGGLSVEESQALTNLSLLNVRLSPNLDKKKAESKTAALSVLDNPYVYSEMIKRSQDKVYKFENSRYTPMIKHIAEDQCKNTVDQHVFPWVKDPPIGEYGDRPSTWADPSYESAAVTASRKKPSWATRKAIGASASTLPVAGAAKVEEDFRANGPRIIMFVIGGITYSEMRAVFEAKKDLRRDIIIGSTHVWQPDGFVEALKDLHRGQGVAAKFMNYHRPLPPPTRMATPPEEQSNHPRERGGPRAQHGDGGNDPYVDPRGDPRLGSRHPPRDGRLSDPRNDRGYDSRSNSRGPPRGNDPNSGPRPTQGFDPQMDLHNGRGGNPSRVRSPAPGSDPRMRGNSTGSINTRSQSDLAPPTTRKSPSWSRGENRGGHRDPMSEAPSHSSSGRGGSHRVPPQQRHGGGYDAGPADDRSGRRMGPNDAFGGSMSREQMEGSFSRMAVNGPSGPNFLPPRGDSGRGGMRSGRSDGSRGGSENNLHSSGYRGRYDDPPLDDRSHGSSRSGSARPPPPGSTGGSREEIGDKPKEKKGWFGFK